MIDVTRLEFMNGPTPVNTPADRHAARLAAAFWCDRHGEPVDTLSELLDELGLAS